MRPVRADQLLTITHAHDVFGLQNGALLFRNPERGAIDLPARLVRATNRDGRVAAPCFKILEQIGFLDRPDMQETALPFEVLDRVVGIAFVAQRLAALAKPPELDAFACIKREGFRDHGHIGQVGKLVDDAGDGDRPRALRASVDDRRHCKRDPPRRRFEQIGIGHEIERCFLLAHCFRIKV